MVFIVGIVAGVVAVIALIIIIVLCVRKAKQKKRAGKYKREVQRQRREELINSGEGEFNRTVHLWDSKKRTSADTYIYLQDLRNENVSFRAELEVFVDIGRTEGDILIGNDSSLSRKHCRIIKRDEGLFLLDLNSSNGTVYDGMQIQQETPIEQGKILEIGRQRLRLELVEG